MNEVGQDKPLTDDDRMDVTDDAEEKSQIGDVSNNDTTVMVTSNMEGESINETSTGVNDGKSTGVETTVANMETTTKETEIEAAAETTTTADKETKMDATALSSTAVGDDIATAAMNTLVEVAANAATSEDTTMTGGDKGFAISAADDTEEMDIETTAIAAKNVKDHGDGNIDDDRRCSDVATDADNTRLIKELGSSTDKTSAPEIDGIGGTVCSNDETNNDVVIAASVEGKQTESTVPPSTLNPPPTPTNNKDSNTLRSENPKQPSPNATINTKTTPTTPADVAMEVSQQMEDDARLVELEGQYVALRGERDTLRQELCQARLAMTEMATTNSSTEGPLLLASREEADRLRVKVDELREEMRRSEDRHAERWRASQEQMRERLRQMASEDGGKGGGGTATTLRYENDHLRKQLEASTSHTEWMESELKVRSQMTMDERSRHSEELRSHLKTLRTVETERDMYQSQFQSSAQHISKLTTQIEALRQKEMETEMRHTDTMRSALEEIEAERQVVSLLERKCEGLQDKLLEATSTMNSMKEMALQAATKQREDEEAQEARLKSIEDEHQHQVTDLYQRMKKAESKQEQAEQELQRMVDASQRRKARIQELMGESTSSGDGTTTAMGGRAVAAIMEDKDDDDLDVGEEQQPQRRRILATPVGLTDLYDRLAETEDELAATSAQNRRLNTYLTKISAEIEANAPQLRKQRRDYMLALQERDKASERLADIIAEKEALERDCRGTQRELERLEKQERDLRLENTDLARQVQALLKHRQEKRAEDDDDMVEFADIQELHEKNRKLLRENRQMESKLEELSERLAEHALTEELTATKEEVEFLREERSQQQKLVAGIVEQRDLYRALLSQHNNDDQEQKILKLTRQDEDKSIMAIEDDKNREEVTRLRAELVAMKVELDSAEERQKRSEAYLEDVQSTAEQLRRDNHNAVADLARTKAESEYYNKRVEDLKSAMEESQRQQDAAVRSVSEAHQQISDLQKALADSSNHHDALQKDYHVAVANAESLKIRLLTAQSTVTALQAECGSLRRNSTTQSDLYDSVRRIEAGLSDRAESDLKELRAQVSSLETKLSKQKEEHKSQMHQWTDRHSDLELKLLAIQKAKDDALTLSISSQKEAEQHRVTAVDLRNHIVDLEKRLEETLKSIPIDAKRTDGVVHEEDDPRVTVASLEEKIQELERELAKQVERTATYKEIAKTHETGLAQLTEASQVYKVEKEKEVQELKEGLDRSLKDAKAKQEALADLHKDLGETQKARRETETELRENLQTLQDKSDQQITEATILKETLGRLEQDLETLKQRTDRAQKNYERELELHSIARSELRTLQSESEAEMLHRRAAEDERTVLKTELDGRTKEWEEERSHHLSQIEELQKSLNSSREQVQLLQNQMVGLTETVHRYQMDAAKDPLLTTTTTSTNTNDASVGNDGSDSVNVASSSPLVKNTETNVSELRRIVQFMQSERTLQEAQMKSLRIHADRERAACDVAKRSLQEARDELRLLQEQLAKVSNTSTQVGSATANSTSSIDDNDANKENRPDQITLLKESNVLLREGAARMQARLESTQKELAELRSIVGPSEEKIHVLEVRLSTADAAKKSLEKELEAWKSRMQNFVSKFQTIDPEEHSKALKAVEESRQECAKLRTAREKAEKDSIGAKAVVVGLNREVSHQKALVKTANANADKARSEAGVLQKSLNDLKSSTELKGKEWQTSENELKAVQARNENLLKILGNMKTKIKDKDKQLKQLQQGLQQQQSQQQQTQLQSQQAPPQHQPPPQGQEETVATKHTGTKGTSSDVGHKGGTGSHTASSQKPSSGDETTKHLTQPAQKAAKKTTEGAAPTSSATTTSTMATTSVAEGKKGDAQPLTKSVPASTMTKTNITTTVAETSTTSTKKTSSLADDKKASSSALSSATTTTTMDTGSGVGGSVQIPAGGFKFAPSSGTAAAATSSSFSGMVKNDSSTSLSKKEIPATAPNAETSIKKTKMIKLNSGSSAVTSKVGEVTKKSLVTKKIEASKKTEPLMKKQGNEATTIKKSEATGAKAAESTKEAVSSTTAGNTKTVVAMNDEKEKKLSAMREKLLEKKRKLTESASPKPNNTTPTTKTVTPVVVPMTKTTEEVKEPSKKIKLDKENIKVTETSTKALTSLSTDKTLVKTTAANDQGNKGMQPESLGGVSNAVPKPQANSEATVFGDGSFGSSSGGGGGAFLNLRPPSSSNPALTFGSSPSITLPVPSGASNVSTTGGVPSFGSSAATAGVPSLSNMKPLFGDSKKRGAPTTLEGSSNAKQSKTVDGAEGIDASNDGVIDL